MTDHVLDDFPGGERQAAHRRLLAAAARQFADERERWPLWLPVGIGLGIAIYFALPFEPAPWGGLAVLAGCAVGTPILRRSLAALMMVSMIIAGVLGFTAAQVRTMVVAAPILEREIGPVPITGRVIDVDRLEKGVRLVLTDLRIERLDPDRTPDRIRVTLRGDGEVPPPGALVRLNAVLNPPPAPAEPGAYDFGRAAYFAGIGGVGFATRRPEIVDGPAPGLWHSVLAAAARLRLDVAERITQAVGGAEGAMVAALLTGERTAIPPNVMDDMRASGLAHLLSISGLHVGLVAGLVMMSIRAGLALIPPVALRFPTKKWAAVAGLLAAFSYMLMVGSPVPTERSVLMTGLALAAILLDRNPLSMRLVAFAAVVVMVLEPHSLLGPSFQMSFAAVVALIAAYEVIRGRWRVWHMEAGWLGRILLYAVGVALTSVVASLATMPFSFFHFQQVQHYGLLANMIAVPVTSFWVMPWGLIGYALMPFGLEAWPLQAMGWGCVVIMETAHRVASLPGASQPVPAMPIAGLGLMVAGGLWLTLWSRPWRLIGLPVIALGLATVAVAPRPDILVTADGKLMAVRDGAGRLALSSHRAERFAAETWLRRDGADARSPAPSWPRDGQSRDGLLSCDALGCLYRVKGQTVALVKDRQALAEDCASADIVISVEPARRCRAPHVIDRFDLWRHGTHALYLGEDVASLRVETVRGWRGERPWTSGPPLERRKVSDNAE